MKLTALRTIKKHTYLHHPQPPIMPVQNHYNWFMLCILELALTHLHNMHVQGVRKILSNGKVRQNTLLCNASFIQKIFVCIIATVKTKNQNCENRRSQQYFPKTLYVYLHIPHWSFPKISRIYTNYQRRVYLSWPAKKRQIVSSLFKQTISREN